MVIVKNAIKQTFEGVNFSKDFMEDLDEAVRGGIQSAKERAKANGRTTIYSQDVDFFGIAQSANEKALVTKSKVKEEAKDANTMSAKVSQNTYGSFDKLAYNLVLGAVETAKANGRKTVQARDL